MKPPDATDTTFAADIKTFFETLKKKNANVLYGLTMLSDHPTISRSGKFKII